MQPHDRLKDILKDFDTAMLVTAAQGGMHARPMAIALVEEDISRAYFSTSIASAKVAEIETEPKVLLTLQSKSRFAALHGIAKVVRDRALIERLWSPAWQVWFPGGKDDPSLCILEFDPTSAEYWDQSGVQGVKYLFEGARAVLQGERPREDSDQHGKVAL